MQTGRQEFVGVSIIGRTGNLRQAQPGPEVALQEVLEAEGEQRREGGEDEGPREVGGQAQARVRQDAGRVAQHVDVPGRYDDPCTCRSVSLNNSSSLVHLTMSVRSTAAALCSARAGKDSQAFRTQHTLSCWLCLTRKQLNVVNAVEVCQAGTAAESRMHLLVHSMSLMRQSGHGHFGSD